jgi:hypothetical protein
MTLTRYENVKKKKNLTIVFVSFDFFYHLKNNEKIVNENLRELNDMFLEFESFFLTLVFQRIAEDFC